MVRNGSGLDCAASWGGVRRDEPLLGDVPDPTTLPGRRPPPSVDGAVPIGRYAKLRLGSMHLGADRREINPFVLSVFSAADRRCRLSADHAAAGGPCGSGDATTRPGGFGVVEYVASAAVVRDRLELAGFTLAATFRALDAAVLGAARTAAEQRSQAGAASRDRLVGSRPPTGVDAAVTVPADLTPTAWLQGLRQIRLLGLRPTSPSDPTLDELPSFVRFMLTQPVDGWYGLPTPDVRHAIRLAVEVGPDDDVVYDLTDLGRGGDYDSVADLLAHADHLLSDDVTAERRVVVLTEGATERWILERSLGLLYPHLSGSFRFMDFDRARVAEGAEALAGVVTAFAEAGISNRVVALFSNDAAGLAALQTLGASPLPSNIVAIPYPRLGSAAAYPTIGPNGVFPMDVNGLAASIELYLGGDVLTENGTLPPVQWHECHDGHRASWGEITTKREVHRRFAAKVAACEAAPERLRVYDWDGVRLLLHQLRGAFQHLDEEEIVAAEPR